MSSHWKEGDKVRVKVRPVTEEDRKKNRYFEHMTGLTGVVQNVYEGDAIAIKVDREALSPVSNDVHKVAIERMREKFLSNASEEAKKSMTKEELDFEAHYVQLVQSTDLEAV